MWTWNFKETVWSSRNIQIEGGKRFAFVWFYGVSNIVGYLMPNTLYTYIYWIWFGRILCHIYKSRSLNVKSSSYIYIKYIWLGLFGFYSISKIIGYLMLCSLYIYILNIYDLFFLFYGISIIAVYLRPNPPYIYIYIIWFGWFSWHINK